MTEKEAIGSETAEVRRNTPMANIGPGHVEYGKGQRFANYRGAGGNLPFTQKIEDGAGAEEQ